MVTPRHSADARGSKDAHSSKTMFELALDAMCCIMVADRQVARAEVAKTQELMKRMGCSWNVDDINRHVLRFIECVKSSGIDAVLEESCLELCAVTNPRSRDTILKCVDQVTAADGRLDDREAIVRERIRTALFGAGSTSHIAGGQKNGESLLDGSVVGELLNEMPRHERGRPEPPVPVGHGKPTGARLVQVRIDISCPKCGRVHLTGRAFGVNTVKCLGRRFLLNPCHKAVLMLLQRIRTTKSRLRDAASNYRTASLAVTVRKLWPPSLNTTGSCVIGLGLATFFLGPYCLGFSLPKRDEMLLPAESTREEEQRKKIKVPPGIPPWIVYAEEVTPRSGPGDKSYGNRLVVGPDSDRQPDVRLPPCIDALFGNYLLTERRIETEGTVILHEKQTWNGPIGSARRGDANRTVCPYIKLPLQSKFDGISGVHEYRISGRIAYASENSRYNFAEPWTNRESPVGAVIQVYTCGKDELLRIRPLIGAETTTENPLPSINTKAYSNWLSSQLPRLLWCVVLGVALVQMGRSMKRHYRTSVARDR